MNLTTFLAFSALFVLGTGSVQGQGQGQPLAKSQFVLIDSDAGIDDAWAILMCLKAHRDPNHPLQIVGITTTHGNTGVDNVTLNVAQTLHAAQESDIPVFRGSDSALVFPIKNDFYFGYDGFGDAGLPAVQPNLQPGHAVSAIINFAENYKDKGQLTFLALAPLTNLATAVRLKPEIATMLKAVYILGGNHQGSGNMEAAAEFNFFADAEAARIVLENLAPTPLHILPFETLQATAPTCAFRKDVLGKIESKAMGLLNKIEAMMVDTYCSQGGEWHAEDSLAASFIIQPNLAVKTEAYFASVELSGALTRGMMVVDKRLPSAKPANVNIVTQMNITVHQETLLWAVKDDGTNDDSKSTRLFDSPKHVYLVLTATYLLFSM